MYVLSVAIFGSSSPFAALSPLHLFTTMSNVPKGIKPFLVKKKFVPRIIIPTTQVEIVPEPIIQPERITAQHDEMNVEVPVPMTQEEKKKKRKEEEFEERIQNLKKRLNKTNNNNMNNNKNYEHNNNDNNKNN